MGLICSLSLNDEIWPIGYEIKPIGSTEKHSKGSDQEGLEFPIFTK